MPDSTSPLPIFGGTEERENTYLFPKQGIDPSIAPDDLANIDINELPTLGENALWYLNEVWWRLDYFHAHPITIDHHSLIKLMKKQFTVEQLNAIQYNLVKQGILSYAQGGLFKGINVARLRFKQQSVDSLEIRANRIIKHGDIIDLDKLFGFQEERSDMPKKVPPSMYRSQSKPVKRTGGEKMEITVKKSDKSEVVTIGGNNLGVALAIWPWLSSGEFIKLDYNEIAKKTGVPLNQICPILSGMCNKGILIKKKSAQATFKKGNPNIMVWSTSKNPTWEAMAGVQISHGKPISLDDLFKPADDVIIGSEKEDLSIPNAKPISGTDDHSNGNGNDEQADHVASGDKTQNAMVQSPKAPASESPGAQNREIPMYAKKLCESARDILVIAEHVNGNSNATRSNDNEEIDTNQGSCKNLNDSLAMLDLALTSLYAEAGRLDLTTRMTEKALVGLKQANQLLKNKDFSPTISDLEEELDILYIESRKNQLAIAAAEESKEAMLAIMQ